MWALLPELRTVFPELASDIDRITSAPAEIQRKRLLAVMLLRAPGLIPLVNPQREPRDDRSGLFQISNQNPSDGNWWCPLDFEGMKLRVASAYNGVAGMTAYDVPYWVYYFDYRDDATVHRTALLELADRVIAWHPLLAEVDFEELEALAHVTNGPKRLSEEIIAWSDNVKWFSYGADADYYLPEALHLAVRSTRWGCRRQEGHGTYSQTAFERLHADYPNSEWAERTPYWFDEPGQWPVRRLE